MRGSSEFPYHPRRNCGKSRVVTNGCPTRLRQRHADDLVRIDYRAIVVRTALLDRVDMLHAFDHAPPHRVLTVQPRRLVEAYEELAVGRIGIAAARHGARAAHMRL